LQTVLVFAREAVENRPAREQARTGTPVVTPRATGQTSIDGFAERSSVANDHITTHTLGLLRSEVRDARDCVQRR
jgi:hypothetical protein